MKTRIALLLPLILAASQPPGKDAAIGTDHVAHAERLAVLSYTEAERQLMLEDLRDAAGDYRRLRQLALPNDLPPALMFDPAALAGITPHGDAAPKWSPAPGVKRPADLNDLAYASVAELAALIRTRQATSVELTRMFLARLKRYDPQLHAVVTLMEDPALEQARRADAEIAAGHYRGPLHGIPYGVKDLFAVPGYPTTWGTPPYKNQVIDATATVVQRLQQAGAVLVAKLSLGELAWGDVWFGGQTRNPWNPKQGSSGSSAGPAAAVSAGLLPFAIGTETYGSIVSPATRTGVTGLRPTFGRVSRYGAMALSWTMDKVGPLCRAVEDCAMVFDAIRGPDGRDPTVIEAPFSYRPRADLSGLRIGVLESDFAREKDGAALDRATLDALRRLGAQLVPLKLSDLPINAMNFILSAEAAAAFDDLTLSHRDELMLRQEREAWPNVFRAAQLIPAVEYIQANRARMLLFREMQELTSAVDLYVAPSVEGDNQLATNLTGHPCVVVPNGFTKPDSPHSITFCGRLYDEAGVLSAAKVYQDTAGFQLRHPPRFP